MYYIIINSRFGQKVLTRTTRQEADEKLKQMMASGVPMFIETEQQRQRATAPMIKPQPKSHNVDGWDV